MGRGMLPPCHLGRDVGGESVPRFPCLAAVPPTHQPRTPADDPLPMNRTANWLLMTSWSITTLALAIAGAAVYLQLNRPGPLVASSDPNATTGDLGSTDLGRAEPEPPRPPAVPLPPVDFTHEGVTMADVVARVIPSVVNISSHHGRTHGRGDEAGDSLGSGVIVSADGLVVTNNHVVEGNRGITVHLSDGRSIEADVVGTDAPSDMALLRLRGSDLNLTPLSYGDSSALRQGDVVLAIGNPFGVGQTVTMGIVSAVGRADMGITEYEDFIQTDAAINPGNSGGALVNMRGELIGINTAILSRSGGAQGIGFAVPTSMVKPIVEQVRLHGRVRRGFLGVGIQDLTPELATEMGLSGAPEGVLVSDVQEDGPAAKGDVKTGDVILTVNGMRTRWAGDLRNQVAMLGPGAKAKLEIMREGKKLPLTVTLSEKPDEQTAVEKAPSDASPLAGLNLRDMSAEIRARLRAPAKLGGVVVAEVAPGSPAEEAGLHEGDVITHIDRKPVNQTSQLKAFDLEKKANILVRVWRNGTNLFIVIRR